MIKTQNESDLETVLAREIVAKSLVRQTRGKTSTYDVLFDHQLDGIGEVTVRLEVDYKPTHKMGKGIVWEHSYLLSYEIDQTKFGLTNQVVYVNAHDPSRIKPRSPEEEIALKNAVVQPQTTTSEVKLVQNLTKYLHTMGVKAETLSGAFKLYNSHPNSGMIYSPQLEIRAK